MSFLKFTPLVIVLTFGATTTKPVNSRDAEIVMSPAVVSATAAPVDSLLESLPESIRAALDKRTRELASARKPGEPLSSVFEYVKRWNPGGKITVAFYGGNTELHRDIEQATKQLTDSCNVELDFGYNPVTNSYRTWSPRDNDRRYKAYIRISFDLDGYWSLVGLDSCDPKIGEETDAVGGHPHQRSMNLGNFDAAQRPSNWRRTVRHEFMHALGFHHEHQHQSNICDAEFRWEDDPGYAPKRNKWGVYVIDSKGRRPGIYTYLGGEPNKWGREKVDFNLRPFKSNNMLITSGDFDAASIMLYRFDNIYYKRSGGPCIPTNYGEDLSPGDVEALRELYPKEPEAIRQITSKQLNVYKRLSSQSNIDPAVRTVFKDKLDVVKERPAATAIE